MAIAEKTHFSIRFKVLMIILAIIMGITAASLGLTFWIGQNQFKTTVEGDMRVSSRIAAALVSRDLELMERDAASAAMTLIMARGADWEKAAPVAAEAGGYLAFVVLDASGIVFTYGEALFPPEAYDNEYARRAFQGETIISTTEKDVNGNLVMRAWSPLGSNRILCAVLPGMLLSKKIAEFQIWETGQLFIVDNEGTTIGYNRSEIIRNRVNFLYTDGADSANRGLGELIRRMIRDGEGIWYYTFEGAGRLCAFTAIAGSEGWVLGVVAPNKESPLSRMQSILLASHGVFLFLGILAALFTANSVAAPFFRIEVQNQRLEELMTAAENASEAKTSFLASMSHEMRTPLNAIIGLSELELASEKLEGGTYENMEKIYDSGMNLLGIINDILDISKIESGKFELVPVDYDFPSLINDTVNLNVVRIGSKPVEFRLHIEETMPAKLFGDELRIKQIFNNLLSNAFKYTKEGVVDWYITGERSGQDFWLISRIEDTGAGIREEDIPNLFTDYKRLDTRIHRNTEGTGLGLSITKRLVERMDGSIVVNSEYGKGSVFIVRFRQKIVDETTIGLDTAVNLVNFRYAVQRRSRNEKLVRAYMPYASVLVVDDVAMNLDVARGMLKPYGMIVDCVESGQKAIDLVRQEKIRYTAIFMDHMMPGMDGIEAVRIIRNEIGTEYARTVPVIALTANAIVGNDEVFLAKGFQAFLSKPIDVIRLDMVVNHWIRNKELEKELKIPMKRVETRISWFPSGKMVEGLDLVRGLRRFEGNEDAYLRVLRSYITHTPALLDSVRTVSPENLEEYRVHIHGIKGSSYTIGAETAGKMAEDLERAARAGDADYLRSNGGPFINAMENLLLELGNFLKEVKLPEEKPEKAVPDPALLAAVRQAAEGYDMEGLESALDGLEMYRYKSGEELVIWLREQASKSEFGQIIKRLTEEQAAGKQA